MRGWSQLDRGHCRGPRIQHYYPANAPAAIQRFNLDTFIELAFSNVIAMMTTAAATPNGQNRHSDFRSGC
jgi:hypothetical protein